MRGLGGCLFPEGDIAKESEKAGLAKFALYVVELSAVPLLCASGRWGILPLSQAEVGS